MRFYRIVFFLCFFSFSVFGQNGVTTLSGVLLDTANNEPIIACNVELFCKKGEDTTFVSGTTSKSDGTFFFKKLATGEYILRTDHVGYYSLVKNILLKEAQPSVELGKLYLRTNDILLQKIIIEGGGSAVTIKKDTIEYSSTAYETGGSAVVEDLLRKLPGVEIDKTGRISINGKEVKRFLVDNEEFFSNDPITVSKNLPTKMIEKLQVFNCKSKHAGFENGSEETVINLCIYPGMKKGFTGNVILGGGQSVSKNQDFSTIYTGSAFLNYMRNNNRYTLMLEGNNNDMNTSYEKSLDRMRMQKSNGSDKILKYSNVMFGLNKEISPVFSLNGYILCTEMKKIHSLISNEDSLQNINSSTSKSILKNALVDLQLSYNPNPTNTFTIRPSIQHHYDDIYHHNDEYGYITRGLLNYFHMFQKEGRVFNLSVSGQYNMDHSNEKNNSTSSEKEDHFYTISVSWEEPLWNNNCLQVFYGFSNCNRQEINDLYFTSSTLFVDALNNFTGHCSSLNIRSSGQKINYFVELNVNLIDSANEILKNSVKYLLKKHFCSDKPSTWNYSSSVHMHYDLGKRSSLSLNYNEHRTQPSSEQLRSDTIKSHSNDWIIGNPALKSEYVHNFDMQYVNCIEDMQLTYCMNARSGFSINEITTEAMEGEMRTYSNVNGNWNSSLYGMFNFPFRNKRFSLGGNAKVSYNKKNRTKYTMHYFSIVNNTNINYHFELIDMSFSVSYNYTYTTSIDKQRPSNNLEIKNQITLHLPYNITLESDISHTCYMKRIQDNPTEQPMLNVSLFKPLFNRKIGTGSIRLQACNMLQKKQNTSTNNDKTITNTTFSYFMCSFTYNFNHFLHGNSP